MSAKHRAIATWIKGLFVAGMFVGTCAWAFDPLLVQHNVPKTPATSILGSSAQVCTFDALPVPLRLEDAVERALCNHPKTRQAWANVQIQAAGVGVARAAYLPTVQGNWQGTRDGVRSSVTGLAEYDSNYLTQLQNASLSLSWVLYDFGGRAANLRSATALFTAAQANQDATLQSVFATVARDFYAAQAARSALNAAEEVERTARMTADAATARVERGVAAMSDQLQAQTAYAEAVVNHTKAEGEWARSLGGLASDMNLAPTTAITLPDVGEGVEPDSTFDESVAALIDDAQRHYPGVEAAHAQVAASRAKAAQIRAEGLPRLSFVTQYNFNNQPSSLQLGLPVLPATRREWYVGFQLTIPLFEGFARTYQAKQADAQVDYQLEVLAQEQQQVGLDVWNSYHALQSATRNLTHSSELLSLAERSYDASHQRYERGVGHVLELLHAQAALANGKRQRIDALTTWRYARLELAAKLGRLGLWSLQSS